MNILGIDYGTKRIGLAIGIGEVNLPLQTIAVEGYKDKIKNIIMEKNIEKAVIGLPLSMSGRFSNTTLQAVSFAEKIKKIFCETYLADERLTTSVLNKMENLRNKNKKMIKDQISAVEILKSFNQGKGKNYFVKDFSHFKVEKIDEIRDKRILLYDPPSYRLADINFYSLITIFTRNPQIYKAYKSKNYEVYNLIDDVNLNDFEVIFSDEKISENSVCPWFKG